MKKVVGQVSELEKREIQILFERRIVLNGKALMVETGRLILTHVKFIL